MGAQGQQPKPGRLSRRTQSCQEVFHRNVLWQKNIKIYLYVSAEIWQVKITLRIRGSGQPSGIFATLVSRYTQGRQIQFLSPVERDNP
jgi:hypothetical protein